jgi:hypothetical protein
VRFSFSAPLHELSWRFPAICHVGFHGIKAYLSIAAHACERFAQCSNTIYSMTDIDKWLENAVQPSCSGFEKENLPPDSRLWQLYSNPHIVCPMLSSLQISGWLSSVKTVALKRENIQPGSNVRRPSLFFARPAWHGRICFAEIQDLILKFRSFVIEKEQKCAILKQCYKIPHKWRSPCTSDDIWKPLS